jgi:hypothetical protein
MEALSILFNKAVRAGFSVGRRVDDPLTISHLLFADDTFIFCEAVPEHLTHLRYILLWFQGFGSIWGNLSSLKLVMCLI